jgi:hypothetical protein
MGVFAVALFAAMTLWGAIGCIRTIIEDGAE